MRKIILSISISLFSLILLFGILEVAAHLISHVNEDGNRMFIVGNKAFFVKPHHLPVKALEERIAEYKTLNKLHPEEIIFLYDSLTGWKPNPAHSGYFNHQSIRDTKEYSINSNNAVIRIGLFGDSFVMGTEAEFEDTWGYLLEERMTEAGYPVEVINFGVAGYGPEQAYLHWQHFGKQFQPDIVIYGFVPYFMERCESMMTPLLGLGEGNFLSKPRFIFENDSLKLINYPTVALENLTATIANLPNWEFLQYESLYYRNEAFENYCWRKSTLLALVEKLYHHLPWIYYDYHQLDRLYDLSGEAARLNLETVRLFKQSVDSTGAAFIVVSLPLKRDMLHMNKHHRLPAYYPLMVEMENIAPVIRTETDMNRQADKTGWKSLYLINHYSRRGNPVVAEILWEYLLKNPKYLGN